MALDPTAPTGVSPAATARAPGVSAKRVYRPACLVRLTVRLDDWSNDDGAQAQDEGKPAKAPGAKAVTEAARLTALQNVRRASGEHDAAADAQAEVARRKAARVKAGKTGSQAAAPQGAPADDHSFTVGIVPQDITVCLNGFRTADRVEFEAMLTELPLPPDLVRSMLVEVYMGTVHVDDFARPDRWIPAIYQQPPMFRGYAEDESLEAGDGELKVVVSALSLEQRLMQLKINPMTPERRVKRGGEPVTDYIRRLISTIPEFNGSYGDAIGVRMFPNVDPAKVPRLDAAMFKRSLQSAASRSQGAGPVQPAPADPANDPSAGQPGGVGFASVAPSIAEVSVWDVITRAAELAGTIPVYDPSIVAREPDGAITPIGANNILLIPPQNIKETPQGGITIPGGPVDGFEREFTIGGQTVRSQVRFMVWGHNIAEMKMARKYGREVAPRVRCVCHNPDGPAGKRVLTSVYPKTLRGTAVSAVGSAAGKGHAPVQEEVVRVIREVRRQEDLDRIAVALYHAIGRREVTCVIETDEMSSYIDPTRPETHNENPDLLSLRPGTPCRVMVARQVQDPDDPGLVVNGLSELMDRRSNPAFLRRALAGGIAAAGAGGADLEAALAKIEAAFQSSRLTDWFYTRNMEIRWGQQDGWRATIELANYVEARSNPANLSADDQQRNDAGKAARPRQKPSGRAAAIQANLARSIDKKGGSL